MFAHKGVVRVMNSLRKIGRTLRLRVDRLGFRLAVLLAIALLPLLIVSVVRSQSVISVAVARSQAALVGVTLQAVRKETILIENAKAVAQSLATMMPPLLDDLPACRRLMEAAMAETQFSFMGFYNTTGQSDCSTEDAPINFGVTPRLAALIADPRPSVAVSEKAPASKTSVVFASHPVFDDGGKLLGFTSVSVPHTKLKSIAVSRSTATFITLRADGLVLTSSGPLEDAETKLPQLFAEETFDTLPLSLKRVGRDGVSRLYSVTPVVDGELYAIATWPEANELGEGFYLQSPALIPILMWIASLGVAWFATTLFVTRDVNKLRRSMRDFADNRVIPNSEIFDTAPRELGEVATTFVEMSETIVRDEAHIEDSLRQKDVLLREVHHRVKNNLQLIASIMSMQMEHTRSPEVERLIRNLHDRVNSLATVHHNLYQTSGQADVTMDELLDSIVKQVVRMGGTTDVPFDLRTKLIPLKLNPDQAVPLALLVTEGLTNAMKYIGPAENGRAELAVELSQLEADAARLTIRNSLSDDAPAAEDVSSTGLGTELMSAFASQLDGRVETVRTAKHFVLSVDFKIEDLRVEDADET